MKIRWTMLIGVTLLGAVVAAQDAPALKTEKDKESYATGVNLGASVRQTTPDLDPVLVAQGLKDALAGGEMLMTEQEVAAATTTLQSNMGQAARADLMRKNKELGEAFLSENKKKEGVITLDSGLQYKIIKTGEGNKPAASDTVVCHYRGTFIDGKEFDSSYRRRQPMIFPVAKAIKGWREALGLMPAGSQWQLFIPPDLAYGARGAGRKIGPEETLIFDVELIAIKDSAAAGASTAQTSLASAVISDIRISFKLDPRLSGATYGGEHWVSPPKYVGANAQDKVEAQAQGVNAKGAPAKINPEWISSDPEMVTVSPIQGDRVTITVKHAGESKVKVAVPGFSKEFVIKAKYQGQFIQIEIAQPVAEKSPGIAVAQGVPTNDVTQKEK